MLPRASAPDFPGSRAALCLLAVLILAKVLVLLRAGIDMGPISWLAYVWQDIAVALAFGVLEKTSGVIFSEKRGPQLLDSERLKVSTFQEKMTPDVFFWAVYALAVVYIAINVAVTGVLASPLTWPMIRAARGPLADSVSFYLTPLNLGAIALVIAFGALLPFWRRRPQMSMRLVVVLVVAMFAGIVIARRIDTRGFDRNAITALAAWPRLSAAAATSSAWRESAFEPAPADHRALAGTARGMNVLVVVLESTGAQYLGMYGAAEDPMPVLTRVSQNALVFDAAYAVYPESIKGLYAAMCARSPRFGVPIEATIEALLASPDGRCEPPTRALSAAGYATSLFHSGRFAYLGMDTLVAGLGFDHVEDAGAIGGQVQSSFGVDEASAVAHTLSWIDTIGPKPFFTVYLPAAGHHPYATTVPGPFTGDQDIARYRNAIHETDEALRVLLDGLASRGRLERTMLIIFGDHGEAFGQHPGNVGHTLFIHDENVRVPYLISIPGVTRNTTRVSSPASVLDTAPTLLDLVGLPAPAGTEGRSLLSPGARVAPFFADYSLGWLGLRDGCWKYQFNVNAARSQLFDVCADSAETIDRAAEQPVRVATYKKTLTTWK